MFNTQQYLIYLFIHAFIIMEQKYTFN